MPTDECQPPPNGPPSNAKEENARERRPCQSALAAACRAARGQGRLSERRHVRAMARRYERQRHLSIVLGWTVPTPRGQDVDLTRRIIRALGHRLHYQVSCAHGEGRRRARLTRIALFGECLVLRRQLEENLRPSRTGSK